MTPQPLEKASTVVKVIEDVEFLVNRCDEHVAIEFRHFLLRERLSRDDHHPGRLLTRGWTRLSVPLGFRCLGLASRCRPRTYVVI